MAVSTPLSDARLNAYDYSSPQALEAQRSMDQAGQAGFQQGLQGVQNQSDAKLKALLSGQQESATLDKQKAMLDQIKSENPAAQAKAGELSVGVDPAVAMQQKMMKTTKDEYDNLDKHFQPQMKDLSSKSQQLEDGLTALSLGTKQGDQAAITQMTKLTDGPATRLTLALLNKQTPASLQGDAEKVMNYWTGRVQSGLSPAEREALVSAFQAHAQNLNSSFQDAQGQFKQQAPHFAPTLAAGGQLDSYLKDFGTEQASKLGRINKLASTIGQPQQVAQAAPAQAAPHGLFESIADKGRSLKDLLFGGASKPTSATAAPQPPQAPGQAMPVGPSGFDPDAFLGGK